MATIKDVAARANVSTATVSRVLNKNTSVKAYVRQRVEQAIAQLNYQPSRAAKNLRVRRSSVIGLIISDIRNPFYTALVRAVEDVALQNKYAILLCNSDEDPVKERLYVEVLMAERVAGLVIVPSPDNDLSALQSGGIPTVVFDRAASSPLFDSVVLDNTEGAYLATSHLIGLGHRRIALIGAPCTVSSGRERQQGYELALRKHGIPANPDLIQVGGFKESGGYQATQTFLALTPRPTALLVANNLMALGAVRALQENGLVMPDDMSFVAFDDMSWHTIMRPPITAVRQPTYHMGELAAQLLMRRLSQAEATPPEHIVLRPELVIRGSTSAPS